jgi:predicted dehydrogenase
MPYVLLRHIVFIKNTPYFVCNIKKAVLCEKPLAMNLVEVTEILAVAKENNRLVMEVLWTCFLPYYQYVLELLKKETFGKIVQLEADFGFKPVFNLNSRVFKKEVGGGSLLHQFTF